MTVDQSSIGHKACQREISRPITATQRGRRGNRFGSRLQKWSEKHFSVNIQKVPRTEVWQICLAKSFFQQKIRNSIPKGGKHQICLENRHLNRKTLNSDLTSRKMARIKIEALLQFQVQNPNPSLSFLAIDQLIFHGIRSL